LRQQINIIIAKAKADDATTDYAEKMTKYLKLTDEVLLHLSKYAAIKAFDKYLADATIFMEFFSTLVIGWQWLKTAVKVQENIKDNTTYSRDLLDAEMLGLRFYFKYEMPKMLACADTLKNTEMLTLD
jgi:butyryl-CoA dehydrogenase